MDMPPESEMPFIPRPKLTAPWTHRCAMSRSPLQRSYGGYSGPRFRRLCTYVDIAPAGLLYTVVEDCLNNAASSAIHVVVCCIMYVCMYVCMCVCVCENNMLSFPPETLPTSRWLKMHLAFAVRKAPLNFRAYFASQLSELASLLL